MVGRGYLNRDGIELRKREGEDFRTLLIRTDRNSVQNVTIEFLTVELIV